MHEALSSQRTAAVSVVIPSFNSGPLVVQAVESVLAQTAVPAEVIVVDDGSGDDTRQRLEPYAGRVRYLYQSNQGVSAARNLGVRSAGQEFVAFLDADDVWHPHKVALQLRAFDRRPDLVMLGTECFVWPSERFPECDLAAEPPVAEVSWERLVVRNYFITSSVVVRRAALDRAGPFDTGMQGPEDRDLWLRIAEANPVANLVAPLTGYRSVPGSVSKQADRCRDGMLRLLRRLDERQVWQGRRWLRRKAYSYVDHSCSYIYGAAGRHGAALTLALKSFAWYPFAYGKGEAIVPCERPKRAAVHLLRWAGLKAPEPEPVNSTVTADALSTRPRAPRRAVDGEALSPVPNPCD